MTTGELLVALFEAYRNQDDNAFMNVGMTLVKEEKEKNHYVLSNKLRKILLSSDERMEKTYTNRLNRTFDLPKDKDNGTDLLKVIYPRKTFDDLIISNEIKKQLDSIIKEYDKKEMLKAYGMVPKRKLLFCGPPGCGKTLCAEVIANSLDLPILYTCFDSLISSYLGETASNIRKVFDYASKNNWILFFDEFDAVGKSRDNIDETSELKRVVNSFLQILDGFECDSLIIAATNHEKSIDTALWRRFDEIILFDLPNCNQITKFIKHKLRAFEVDNLNIEYFAKKLKGCSYADIERVCIASIKKCIMNGNEPITDKIFGEYVVKELKRAELIRKIGE